MKGQKSSSPSLSPLPYKFIFILFVAESVLSLRRCLRITVRESLFLRSFTHHFTNIILTQLHLKSLKSIIFVHWRSYLCISPLSII